MLHSVDTTVFGFSPGNLFNVDSVAKRSLIISSVAAATGLFVDVWFVFVYSGADAGKFQVSRCFLLSTWGSTVLTIFFCDIHTDARGGHLRLVFLLRAFFTPTPCRALCRRPRPRRLPRRHDVDCVAHRSARHVRIDGRADQLAIHRVWLPPPCTGPRVDSARSLAWSGLCWEQGSGYFHA